MGVKVVDLVEIFGLLSDRGDGAAFGGVRAGQFYPEGGMSCPVTATMMGA
jgi:hypothetical protein